MASKIPKDFKSSSIKDKNLKTYSQDNNEYEIRKELHEGKEHIVVPVIMMVEGVHSGSKGSILHLANEMGKIPASWNGIPAVINHPKNDDGPACQENENLSMPIEQTAGERRTNTEWDQGEGQSKIEKRSARHQPPRPLEGIGEEGR